MTELEVLEGTWEELAAHAAALKGRKLRLIVLAEEDKTPSVPGERQLHEIAERLFAETDNLDREPGKPSSDPYKKVFRHQRACGVARQKSAPQHSVSGNLCLPDTPSSHVLACFHRGNVFSLPDWWMATPT
jgi:hypothetical protein